MQTSAEIEANDDDADDLAEGAAHEERADQKDKRTTARKKDKKKKASGGQNKARDFGKSEDTKSLCPSRIYCAEFAPLACRFGADCRFEHNLRTYLTECKREDLTTFNSKCPVWEARGKCSSGWKCRFVGSHMTEQDGDGDGRKELVLVEDEEKIKRRQQKRKEEVPYANEDGVVNVVSIEDKFALAKKKVTTPRADAYSTWLEKVSKQLEHNLHGRPLNNKNEDEDEPKKERLENQAQYIEPPLLPSEKRRIYFGAETPVLAPLTTQGNIPFRRICTDLGAQFTYSEMAMALPLVQGSKSEWALAKAHESEMLPPTVNINQQQQQQQQQGYNPSSDIRFGAQIAASKLWQAFKATEVLATFTPHLRLIDLNCGCPIDLVFREGSGSGLLEHPAKLEKILRGMNTVSNSIPITAKIRMGTRDSAPNATKVCERLVLGGHEAGLLGMGAPGVAAITLHGRSRQQRYTKQADWSYIAECSAMIKQLNEQSATRADTATTDPDPRTLPNGGKTYFLGNGDCYSHVDYYDHIEHGGVDSVMVARGALIKPWLFEEIQSRQYLDKSASERLSLVEKYARYGLEVWGSDEHGVGLTRRFLLEWLSFAYRYVPIGLLEYLPPYINDRPPAFEGRSDLETLLASGNYRDWIKITYGPFPFSFFPSFYIRTDCLDAEKCSSDLRTRTSSLNRSTSRMPTR